MTQLTAKKLPQAKIEKDTLQYLLRVDRAGRPLGFEEKEKCRRGRGIWHSAFLGSAISPNEAQKSELRFSGLPALRREVENQPGEPTPWFLLAFAKLPKR
jgi:hypothetical protein